jgi:hypothetical protein
MKYTALINDGKFNGKQPFVYYITNKDTRSDMWLELLNSGGCYEIEITKDEYDYINLIDDTIDVIYLSDEKERFYY